MKSRRAGNRFTQEQPVWKQHIGKRGNTMVRFYDPKDEADLARVEAVLHKGGIEYFLAAAPAGAASSVQIEVAEEDVPKAEELLVQGSSKG
jgi:hypothetical protein